MRVLFLQSRGREERVGGPLHGPFPSKATGERRSGIICGPFSSKVGEEESRGDYLGSSRSRRKAELNPPKATPNSHSLAELCTVLFFLAFLLFSLLRLCAKSPFLPLGKLCASMIVALVEWLLSGGTHPSLEVERTTLDPYPGLLLQVLPPSLRGIFLFQSQVPGQGPESLGWVSQSRSLQSRLIALPSCPAHRPQARPGLGAYRLQGL